MDGMPERSSFVVSREAIIEIAGYVGAAVGLTAAAVALGEDASDGVQIAFDLITAAVLVGAGWALEASNDSYRRMRSVLWFLSAFLVADLAGTLFADESSNPKTVLTLVALVTTIYSFPLWWLSRRSLQMIALLVSAYLFVVGLVAPDPTRLLFGVPDLTGVAMVTWIYGGALVGIGAFTTFLVPRKTTLVLGSIAAIGGPLLLLSGDSDVLGELLSLATAAALVLVGRWLGELAVSGLGIVGLLLASAIIVRNHVEDQGPAIVVLLIGLLLLAGAIGAARGVLWGSGPAAPPPSPPWTPTTPETQGGGS
jgi:hypothetical protein